MSYAPPTSWDEYQRVFHSNTKVTGRFMETTVHAPCPWCAAPDFMVYKVVEVAAALRQGATCKECGRSMRTLPIEGEPGAFEFVQSGGPDAPDWMPTKPRRVEQGA